jgi:hypothetical protein
MIADINPARFIACAISIVHGFALACAVNFSFIPRLTISLHISITRLGFVKKASSQNWINLTLGNVFAIYSISSTEFWTDLNRTLVPAVGFRQQKEHLLGHPLDVIILAAFLSEFS